MTSMWICENCGKEFPGKRRGIFGDKPPKCKKCKSKNTKEMPELGRVGRSDIT
jgi:DNA-directed RNA polymerase subunit RPC12/RpoP